MLVPIRQLITKATYIFTKTLDSMFQSDKATNVTLNLLLENKLATQQIHRHEIYTMKSFKKGWLVRYAHKGCLRGWTWVWQVNL